MSFRPVAALIAAALIGVESRAADIHLKAQAAVRGQAVCLGDVAEVHGGPADEARRIAHIELFGAPPRDQFITAHQVREALLAQGVDLRQHTISGASIVELVSAAKAISPGIFARRAISSEHSPNNERFGNPRAGNPVEEAIVRFLKSRVDAELPWQVHVLPDAQIASRSAGIEPSPGPPPGATDVAVTQTHERPQRGTIRPWLGKQQLMMRWAFAGRRQEGPVTVEIKLPATVVVAARDLPRGAILQADDLRTKVASDQDNRTGGLDFSEDAIGQETLRPLRAGQVIEAEGVESPELVRRGEPVSIVVNHGGVRVRTEGRARDSGKRGDVVMVESANRRNAFQAVVTGVNEVKVSAGATVVARPREEWTGHRR
jgi:flagella basal body P-ring formation protein FlgA